MLQTDWPDIQCTNNMSLLEMTIKYKNPTILLCLTFQPFQRIVTISIEIRAVSLAQSVQSVQCQIFPMIHYQLPGWLWRRDCYSSQPGRCFPCFHRVNQEILSCHPVTLTLELLSFQNKIHLPPGF